MYNINTCIFTGKTIHTQAMLDLMCFAHIKQPIKVISPLISPSLQVEKIKWDNVYENSL